MAWFRPRLVKRRRDGRYELAFADELRDLLGALAEQLTAMLDEAPDDPSLRRLFPAAYPDDPFRDAEYQVLSGDRLRDGRRAGYGELAELCRRETLTEEELSTVMRVVNDLRLVVGTRLDVSEEDGPLDHVPDPDDPEDQLRWLYEVLTMVEGEVVEALMGSL